MQKPLVTRIAKRLGFDGQYSDASPGINLTNEQSLSKYLTYKYFDENNFLFLNNDGYAGFLMELSPIVGVDETIEKNLVHFFNYEMPLGSWIQFLLVASTDIRSNLDYWKSDAVSPLAPIKGIISARSDFLSRLSVDFKVGGGMIPRNFRLFLSFNSGKASNQLALQKIKYFAHSLRQKLETINLAPRMCDATDLIGLVRELVELDLSGNRASSYNPNILISDQILTPGFCNKILEDRIEHKDSGLTSKCYYPLDLPKEFGLSDMIRLLGDGMRDHLSIPARFVISYTIANHLNGAAQSAITQKGTRIIDSSEEWYSRNNRDIKREAMEWRDVADRAKNGEIFLTEYFQIMITASSDFIDEAEQSLFSLYHILDWRLRNNKYFQLPALLSILPLNGYGLWKTLQDFKLTRIALSEEIVAKLPIHGEWRGVPRPGMLLMGRRGQLFHWNPFYRISSGNYNVCVFGPSGSGKSVFLQEFAINMAAQNAKIFILDIGQSFKNICKLLGGEIIEFNRSSGISLNPFSGFKSKIAAEDRSIAISYAKSIICSMTGSKGDSFKESIIEKCIKRGLEIYSTDLDITKLAEILSEMSNSEVANALSHSLFSYGKDGIYGKFFSGASGAEIKFDKQVTVFEFEEIKNDQLLLAVVLQIIGMQIFMQVLTGERSQQFVLIVDEAWMILDHAAKFLAELARTIRKYGGCLVVCVQNFSDLDHSEHHRAVLQNSTWTVLLKQDEKGINAFKESEAFKDMIPLIKSISIAKDKYAEMLLCATGVQVVGRLVLDDYSKILYSTDAEIFNSLHKLMDTGVSLSDAVEIIRNLNYG